MSESISALQAQLFSQPAANVFAILDGASIPDLLAQLEQYQPEYGCLYRGELPADLAAAAPYLVRLEQGSALVKWLLLEGWGRHWGIFAVAKANLRTMRQHFRSLLTVQLPDGKTVYFRFYDPRVFRTFLPTCRDEERQRLFGPILQYWVESGHEETIFLPFSLKEN
jgi:hypothetical protein